MAQGCSLGILGLVLFAHVGMAENVQPFRVRCHHAVLDAIVDHLDEVARAARTAMQIAVFGCAAYLLPAGRAGRRIDAWGQCGKNGFDALDDGFIPADHQAVASL